jgi:hypothetical protein
MRALLATVLIFSTLIGYAESVIPTGCQAIAIQGESIHLKSKKSKLIYIHNTSDSDLWITHPVTEPSANAGWTTRIQSGNWSALALNKPPFILNCIESRPGHEQQVPCESVVGVCLWKGVKIPEGNQGTFWAAEDQTLDTLTAALNKRGFVLPAAK